MLARAIALASVLGEDAAPLGVLPEPFATEARAARARLTSAGPSGRAAAIARETVALFALAPTPGARRVLARGLAPRLAPEPARPAAPLPGWLGRPLAACSALGVAALARASAGAADGSTAELLRRLTADEAAQLLAARRRPAAPGDVAASRRVVALAQRDERVSPLARRVGLYRLAWAASVEPGGLAALAAAVPASDRATVRDAGHALWFMGSEGAVAEQARLAADLGEAS